MRGRPTPLTWGVCVGLAIASYVGSIDFIDAWDRLLTGGAPAYAKFFYVSLGILIGSCIVPLATWRYFGRPESLREFNTRWWSVGRNKRNFFSYLRKRYGDWPDRNPTNDPTDADALLDMFDYPDWLSAQKTIDAEIVLNNLKKNPPRAWLFLSYALSHNDDEFDNDRRALVDFWALTAFDIYELRELTVASIKYATENDRRVLKALVMVVITMAIDVKQPQVGTSPFLRLCNDVFRP